ncbi:MAG: hypothetical protein WA117_06935 [Verrucomicrobiia bacterium]
MSTKPIASPGEHAGDAAASICGKTEPQQECQATERYAQLKFNGENNMITAKDIYLALNQTIIHAETISWNRFYNFLMFNTILVLAWATIYAQMNRPPMARTVMAVMCALGFFSGLFWWGLGLRGRDFLQHYRNLARQMERNPACWPTSLNEYKIDDSTESVLAKFKRSPCALCGSRTILTWGSLAVAAFYVFLLYASTK